LATLAKRIANHFVGLRESITASDVTAVAAVVGEENAGKP
jgi:hypothetical protein